MWEKAAAHQSSSLESSTLVWFSPFLYSRGQSNSSTRGLGMRRRMRPGATTSFWNITPASTRQSSMEPPGSFSTCKGQLTFHSATAAQMPSEPLLPKLRLIALTSSA